MSNSIKWMTYKDKAILIYGAHLVAQEVYRDICYEGCGQSVIGFAVTSMEDNPTMLEGLPVRKISDYRSISGKAIVVIAMPKKFHIEVRDHAMKLGFKEFKDITLEDMSEIKGDRLIRSWDETAFYIRKSKYDPTWLDGYRAENDNSAIFKLPTLFHLNEDEIRNNIRRNNPVEVYEKELKDIINLHELPSRSKQQGEELEITDILQIYMAFSAFEEEYIKKITLPEWIVPIRVGNKKIKRESLLTDDIYPENISEKNSLFAEMTGTWGIWHEHRSIYKGLCHYRRHFVISKEEIMRLYQNDIDVLLTMPRYVPGGIGKMFIAETPVKEQVIESIREAMRQSFKEDEESFEEYLDSFFYFPNNMVVAKDGLFDNYCKWIFPILEEMHAYDKKTEYGHEKDRHIAYAAELLTSYYFARKMDGLKLAVTDYRFLYELGGETLKISK